MTSATTRRKPRRARSLSRARLTQTWQRVGLGAGALSFAVAASYGLLAAACSYDYNVFDPSRFDASTVYGVDGAPDAADRTDTSDDALVDGGSDDADVDSGARDSAPACAPVVSCLTTSASCASTCHATEQTCEAKVGCGISAQCLADCKSAESNCKNGCIGACTVCTADGGCLDPAACSNAAK